MILKSDPSDSSHKRQGLTQVIEPRGRLFDFKLGELWQYRDLVKLLVWRNFVASVKQTILGHAWHFISPLLGAGIFTIIFGKIAGLSTDGLPHFVFYMAGNVIWGFFSGVFLAATGTFINNAGLFGKVYFPRLAIPVSTLISRLVAFGLQFLLLICFIIYFIIRGNSVQPNLWILLTPILLFIMGGIGLGAGIIISSLTTRYRDLQMLVGIGVNLLMYATPIIYPLSIVSGKYKVFILANPITAVVETFRYAYLGAGTFNILYLLYSLAFSIAILVIGIIMFNKVERTFMDTI